MGDYLFDVLESYGEGFDTIEFMSGDVIGALCDKLKTNKDINRAIPLVGCACHRLNLAVKKLYQARHC